MAVPKRRHSRATRDMRRSHHALKPLTLVACPRCQTQILPHMACPNCGFYRGREVINMLAKTDKKERKAKAKARQQT